MARAIVIRSNPAYERGNGQPVNTAAIEEVDEAFLGDDPVLVEVSHSSINYKDAMALTGLPGIVRKTPLIGGIDLVGTVKQSADPVWNPGDQVILNGIGMSESRNGAFCELARVPGDRLVALPESMTPARAAAIGTAGYTAALCVLRLGRAGLETTPDRPVLVTGATGGVGSVAVLLLAAAGHHVAALTGRPGELGGYLHELGAEQIIDRAELLDAKGALQKQRWSGVVDTVGGEVLVNALAQTVYSGTVAACGLAGSAKLPGTVMPFILRNVTLAGVDSVEAPVEARREAWALLAELPGERIDAIAGTVPLSGAFQAARDLMEHRLHGRVIVDVRA
ncbi:MDR family oxidoreductase [Propionibacterium australiense]|uniref:Oxidoreductase n=1 Tax=Propionibacterium australiense TaxID=119981 RepID=A0A8B3FQ01_9ACTN|nr:MDR family oxidoreductase [Propionibacterium australiense]RLP13123.1 oxidoreductase [Propionibacterium australiense]